MANALYYGDNLDVLRNEIASDGVDLVYLDPPFNSQTNYNVLFKSPAGKAADAQIEAFEDEREKAAVGVLISLALPTRAMEGEAAAAGLYETPFESVPKIQIIILAELFQGIRPRIPRIDVGVTFRAAARESTTAQGRLL